MQNHKGVRIEDVAVDSEGARVRQRYMEREMPGLAFACKREGATCLEMLHRGRGELDAFDRPVQGRACGSDEAPHRASHRFGELIDILVDDPGHGLKS